MVMSLSHAPAPAIPTHSTFSPATRRRRLGAWFGALVGGVALTTTLTGCGGIPGDGVADETTRSVALFTGIDVSGSMSVIVRVNPEAASEDETTVRVSGDQNLLEHVRTEVSGGVLAIGTDGWLSPTMPLVVEVDAPYIDVASVSGSSELKLLGFVSESLEVNSSGSSDILLRGSADSLALSSSGSSDIRVEVEDSERVTIDTSGSSDISVCGEADTLEIRSSGSSDVGAHTMIAGDVAIQSSGSSDIVVCVRGSLHANISGSGDVTYLCNPESVTSDVSGSGDIKPG